MADYKVETEISLKGAKKTEGQLVSLSGKMRDQGNQAAELTRNIMLMVGAYAGLSAAISGVKAVGNFMGSATKEAFKYQSQLESTKIGLTSVFQALNVAGKDWASNSRQAGVVFEKIKRDSIKSTATAGQMLQIYQAISGPIISATGKLEDARAVMKDTVAAANVLNVDLEQAQRDIAAMARGGAGLDVKLFSMLQSTGAIAENAEQFNKLMASDRVEKIKSALAKFAPSADKFGKSWEGITSTFGGIREELGSAAFVPIMQKAAKELGEINALFIANEKQIRMVATATGNAVVKIMSPIVSMAIKGLGAILGYLERNGKVIAATIDTIGTVAGNKIQQGANYVKMVFDYYRTNMGFFVSEAVKIKDAFIGFLPKLAAAAKVMAGIKIGTMAMSGIMAISGAISGIASLVSGLGTAIAGAGGISGIAATVGSMASVEGAIAAISAAAAPALPALGYAAIAIAIAWALIEGMIAQFDALYMIVAPQVEGLVADIIELFLNLYKALAPVLRIVGSIVIYLASVVFVALIGILRGVIKIVNFAVWTIGQLTQALEDAVMPTITMAFKEFSKFIVDIYDMVRWLLTKAGIDIKKAEPKGAEQKQALGWWSKMMAGSGGMSMYGGDGVPLSLRRPADIPGGADGLKFPGNRSKTTVNQRIDRVVINQEFSGSVSPDRVISVARRDLARQAEFKLQSGFRGTFSR